MSNFDNPHVTAIQRQHRVTRSVAHAMWMADPNRKPWITRDVSMDDECGCCGQWHHMDDDCPPPLPRHYYEEE